MTTRCGHVTQEQCAVKSKLILYVCGSDRRRVHHRPSASRHLPGTGVVIPELDSTRRFYKVSFFAGERGSVVNDAFSMNDSSVSFRHLGVTQLVRIIPEWGEASLTPKRSAWDWPRHPRSILVNSGYYCFLRPRLLCQVGAAESSGECLAMWGWLMERRKSIETCQQVVTAWSSGATWNSRGKSTSFHG